MTFSVGNESDLTLCDTSCSLACGSYRSRASLVCVPGRSEVAMAGRRCRPQGGTTAPEAALAQRNLSSTRTSRTGYEGLSVVCGP